MDTEEKVYLGVCFAGALGILIVLSQLDLMAFYGATFFLICWAAYTAIPFIVEEIRGVK